MKKTILLLAFLILLSGTFFSFQKEVPGATTVTKLFDFEKWDSSFVIHLYYGGGMRYESDNIYLRYDSCINIHMENGHDLKRAFAMTPELRTQVLNALKQYKADKIRQEDHKELIHDKATTSICYSKGNEKQCNSSGSSSSVHKDDAVNFSALWTWLSDFSLKSASPAPVKPKGKGKKGKKSTK